MNQKILITGATGYIGKHLLSKFKFKNSIIVSRKSNRNTIQCDLSNYTEVKNLTQSFNISKVINLASFVPKKNDEYFSKKCDINELIVNNIIKNFKCDLIHISSLAIYENSLSKFINEKTKIYHPLSNYSLSKYNSEKLVINNYKYPFLILRIPGIFGGDRKSGLIYKLIVAKKNKQKFNYNLPSKNWTIMYLFDLLEILNQSIKIKIKKNNIINVNYKHQLTPVEIINFILQEVDYTKSFNVTDKNKFLYATDNFFKYFKNNNISLKRSIIEYINIIKNA